MNASHELTNDTASPAIYQRCLWALATTGVVIVFFFLSWLSILRVEILVTRIHLLAAQRQAATAEQERDAALRNNAAATKVFSERLAKSEAARIAAEKEARQIAATAVKSSASSRVAEPAAKPEPMQTGTSGPTIEGLATFIKGHLSRMTEAVEAQLPDYADEVDFHDKPHASQITIRNDREQLILKFPVRVILKDEIQPQISAIRDARYGWIATATFDWRWVYKSRSGALARGLTRDIWKIIPAAEGFKIISEHSFDPATGQPRD